MAQNMTRADSEFEKVQHPVVSNLHIHISELMNIRPHSHGDFEIIMVLEGEIQVKTMSEDFILHENEIAFFPRYMPHSCIATMTSNVIIAIQVDAAFCKAYYPQLELFVPERCNLEALSETEAQIKGLQELKRICSTLAYNYFLQKNGFEFRCMSDINRFFGCMIYAIPHHFQSETERLAAVRNEVRMQRILKYIDQHFTEKISLAEIARQENLSVPYLSYMFRQYLNQTFQEYVKMLRFEKALFLLRNTDLKIYDICVECGISDPKYLNFMVQEIYHTTPSVFRRGNSGEDYLPPSNNLLIPNQERMFTYEEALEIIRKHYEFMCE